VCIAGEAACAAGLPQWQKAAQRREHAAPASHDVERQGSGAAPSRSGSFPAAALRPAGRRNGSSPQLSQEGGLANRTVSVDRLDVSWSAACQPQGQTQPKSDGRAPLLVA